MALPIAVVTFLILGSMIGVFGYRRYVLAGRLYENIDPGPTLQSPSPDAGSQSSGAMQGLYAAIFRAAAALAGKLPPPSGAASALQLKLLAAGYREPNAVTILYGLKLLAMGAVTLAMLLLETHFPGALLLRLTGIAIGLLAGFRLPDFFLARQVTLRQKKLRGALPDALDLIVVCAEAGLTIDRSFRNVSHHLSMVHPELCAEFSLFTAEVSAGLRRKEALEGLAVRTQEPEMRKFVAVLSQADRFGTSMAEALRTHAEYLRRRRHQEAEERASKVGVKLIFPIFFFIMPCMMLVTVGPAAITIASQITEIFSGGR